MSFLEFLHFPILGVLETTAATISLYAAIASAAASAAGSYISYQSSQTQAKQAEYNAQAQADAISAEQKRQAAENEENRRRAVQEQRRFRAQQLATMSGSGAMLGTGSSLALEADTWAKQQTELADQQRVNDLAQNQLAFQRRSTLAMGQAEAGQIRANATGQAISSLASTAGQGYQAWSTRPQKAAAPTYDKNGVVRAVAA
ncbi:hypothetical protein UFOVP817_16 [uncultured Caudovirales phage]|uniref:Uncharacterized protein n=1 Tax=uncultured Caudovirales phage TaxID=2100421 RepID=A0A6J5P7B5_9CAUD|nr:hypothetical protein UFOVP817_16 [uncultured Caudovirales phage]